MSSVVKRFFTSRPPFYEVIPKKKVMNRILFDLDAKHSFNKLYPVYESIYKKLDGDGEAEIPAKITANDLMVMKRALETVRVQSHSTNKHLVSLENSLVEYAAERGNNDAVSLLAYEALLGNDEEDKQHAKKLISKLLEMKHPLTVKLSGDLCLRNKMNQQAEQFYLDFIALEDDTFLASEVFKQLGILSFQKPDLIQARHWFSRSVKTGPLDKVAECHYYLGQLNGFDPKRSRYHLEAAASQGFKESFKQLGFLELNQFGNVRKATEWFKLGTELGDVDCVVGLFDCFMKENKFKMAYGAYTTLKQNETAFEHFTETRTKSIALMNENYTPLKNTMANIEKFQQSESTTVNDNDRWNI